MKVLNLYAGIGGNRKLWKDVEVTAVEWDKQIAGIYQDFFPDDKVIVADAHQYLLDHYNEFDFIWSSPPCPTHSRMNFLLNEQMDKGRKMKYPDMKLYEEIIFLKYWFSGKFVVENVKSYYDPLIIPYEIDNHFFWTNFRVDKIDKIERGIRTQSIEEKELTRGFDLSEFDISKGLKKKVLNNCVFPEVGLHLLNRATGIIKSEDIRQPMLF